MYDRLIIIIIIIILMTIKARKPISHNIIVQLFIMMKQYFCNVQKHMTHNMLKMYVRCVSVAADSEMNLHLSTLFRWGKAGLRSEQ